RFALPVDSRHTGSAESGFHGALRSEEYKEAMSGPKRIAVVTGANRGIGLEICRQLGVRSEIHVVLTSRDDSKGRTAAKKLAGDRRDVEFRTLDVTKERSIKAFADYLGSVHGRCDILV